MIKLDITLRKPILTSKQVMNLRIFFSSLSCHLNIHLTEAGVMHEASFAFVLRDITRFTVLSPRLIQ